MTLVQRRCSRLHLWNIESHPHPHPAWGLVGGEAGPGQCLLNLPAVPRVLGLHMERLVPEANGMLILQGDGGEETAFCRCLSEMSAVLGELLRH